MIPTFCSEINVVGALLCNTLSALLKACADALTPCSKADQIWGKVFLNWLAWWSLMKYAESLKMLRIARRWVPNSYRMPPPLL
jgi:hypothetical protein